jgi:lysozyme
MTIEPATKAARPRRRRGATRMSKQGLEFLIREEGFVPYAYNDSRNNATFGVGHLLHLGPVTPADRREWGTRRNPKSREFVLEVLERDVASFTEVVLDAVRVRLSANELDALDSLAFNIGPGAFRASTVVKRLNAGDRAEAADAILMWRIPAELIPRRHRERALFLRRSAELGIKAALSCS